MTALAATAASTTVARSLALIDHNWSHVRRHAPAGHPPPNNLCKEL
jgi:hypothetical protein